MGILDVVKQLFGDSSPASPGLWNNLSDEELSRAWRAKDTLPPATRLGVRDEHIRRLLPLPPVDVPSIYSPPTGGLTDERDAEQTVDVLNEYDPRACPELTDLRVGPLGALMGLGTDQAVMIVFDGWRSRPSEDSDYPALADGETLAAAIAAHPGVDLSRFRDRGVACHGDADNPITEPLTIGAVTALPHATYPQVLHLHEGDGATVLVGTSVPLAVFEEEPDYVVGGLSIPRDDEALDAILSSWDVHVAATSVEQIFILPDAKGVEGLHVGEVARGLGLAPRILVNGQLITVSAQPVVDAAERGEWDEVVALMADRDPTTLDEAFRVLVISDRLDDARLLLERAPREGMRGGYLAGLLSQLAGDVATAREAYHVATEGDDPASGAHCQLARLLDREGDVAGAYRHAEAGAEPRTGDPIAAANHAIAAWRAGETATAQEVMQETQLAARSWLGAMLDAMLASEPGEQPAGLLSVAGTHLGPYATALEALRSGAFEEGERLLRRCIALAPEHPGAQGHLAMHLAAEGRADEALALCEATLKDMPHHVFMQSIRGWLLLHAGRFDDAVKAYESAIAQSDDHGDWWINLVLGQVAQGKPDVAEGTIASLEGRIRDLDLITKLRRALRDAG